MSRLISGPIATSCTARGHVESARYEVSIFFVLLFVFSSSYVVGYPLLTVQVSAAIFINTSCGAARIAHSRNYRYHRPFRAEAQSSSIVRIMKGGTSTCS